MGVAVGDKGADSLLYSGEHVGKDGMYDSVSCLGCLVVALGVQRGGLLGGEVIGALGNVDAVAEDDCGRKWGRGRGELSDKNPYARGWRSAHSPRLTRGPVKNGVSSRT